MKSCKKVLVIEDDQAIRQMVQDVLELEGYETSGAANGNEGIEYLQKSDAGKPCVIILDMMMPVANGWQFLDFQRNHQKLADIPVIVCSAFKESAKTVRPSAFIEKPIKLNVLREAVKALCA